MVHGSSYTGRGALSLAPVRTLRKNCETVSILVPHSPTVASSCLMSCFKAVALLRRQAKLKVLVPC